MGGNIAIEKTTVNTMNRNTRQFIEARQAGVDVDAFTEAFEQRVSNCLHDIGHRKLLRQIDPCHPIAT